MRRLIGFALAALLLGGCAVYADPYAYSAPPPPVAGVYVAPPPVVVAPAPYYWGWHYRYHHG
jgi:PBP1b-binding outer membrane lipoprotein LpoB